jgi:hypothetical protein
MKLKSVQRCCPKCGHDEFESASCAEGMRKLSGYTVVCLHCDWHGYKLQLKPKPEITPTNEVIRKINEEVEAQLVGESKS